MVVHHPLHDWAFWQWWCRECALSAPPAAPPLRTSSVPGSKSKLRNYEYMVGAGLSEDTGIEEAHPMHRNGHAPLSHPTAGVTPPSTCASRCTMVTGREAKNAKGSRLSGRASPVLRACISPGSRWCLETRRRLVSLVRPRHFPNEATVFCPVGLFARRLAPRGSRA